jgi:hypothetical protein
VLRPAGRLTLVLIGQNGPVFNSVYQAVGTLVPAFWGRQVEQQATEWITAGGFAISYDRTARQIFYPSRVLVAGKVG